MLNKEISFTANFTLQESKVVCHVEMSAFARKALSSGDTHYLGTMLSMFESTAVIEQQDCRAPSPELFNSDTSIKLLFQDSQAKVDTQIKPSPNLLHHGERARYAHLARESLLRVENSAN